VTDVAGTDVTHSLDVLAAGVANLIHAVDDPSRPAVGHWTVGNVIAHLVSSVERYLPIITGHGSPITSFDGVPCDEEARSVHVDPTDLPAWSDRYTTGATRCLAALRTAPPEIAWHGGLPLPRETIAAILAGEAAVHGYDIARAAGLAWRIPRGDARAVFRALAPLVCHDIDPAATAGVDARLRLWLRGDPLPPLTMHIRDGALSIIPGATGPVDCTLWADPVAWLLTSYGRMGSARAVLTGGVVAWGRRPWLVLRLSWLRSPWLACASRLSDRRTCRARRATPRTAGPGRRR
jgi:uncharacterized protein (TIGR03083 family)